MLKSRHIEMLTRYWNPEKYLSKHMYIISSWVVYNQSSTCEFHIHKRWQKINGCACTKRVHSPCRLSMSTSYGSTLSVVVDVASKKVLLSFCSSSRPLSGACGYSSIITLCPCNLTRPRTTNDHTPSANISFRMDLEFGMILKMLLKLKNTMMKKLLLFCLYRI